MTLEPARDSVKFELVMGIIASLADSDCTIRIYGDSIQVSGCVDDDSMRLYGFTWSNRHGFWWRKWAE